MRPTGTRPGLSVMRLMIEQTARRRMGAAVPPGRGVAGPSVGADAARRWGREFFETLRGVLVPRMAPVVETPEGWLRYLGSPALSLWAFGSDLHLALAHEYTDTPEQIVERARRWLGCLRTRTAPGLASPHWGHPVYGARLDPLSGELDVVWAVPGDWCEAVLAGRFPEREWDAPRSWSRAPELQPA